MRLGAFPDLPREEPHPPRGELIQACWDIPGRMLASAPWDIPWKGRTREQSRSREPEFLFSPRESGDEHLPPVHECGSELRARLLREVRDSVLPSVRREIRGPECP